MLQKLNSPFMYALCGSIVAVVALICIVFMIRAYRAGKKIGMDTAKMKRTIISSATFSVLPSVAILLGVIALSGSLGTPWPWLRLSVVGALHYEAQVAEAASEATGAGPLSIANMTPSTFSTIALLMSVCIMWGMVLCIFNCKAYNRRLHRVKTPEELEAEAKKNADKKSGKKKVDMAGFGDVALSAMFIGLVSAYIGSYIGQIVSGEGLFTFRGSWMPLAVAVIAGLAMAVFLWIKKKFKADWVDSFSLAASMLIAMGCAVFLGKL